MNERKQKMKSTNNSKLEHEEKMKGKTNSKLQREQKSANNSKQEREQKMKVVNNSKLENEQKMKPMKNSKLEHEQKIKVTNNSKLEHEQKSANNSKLECEQKMKVVNNYKLENEQKMKPMKNSKLEHEQKIKVTSNSKQEREQKSANNSKLEHRQKMKAVNNSKLEREQKKMKASNKSKVRREAKKAERAKQAAAQLLVNQANALPDPLAKFSSFTNFDRNGLSCRLICKRVKHLDPDLLEWAIDLCKKNMQPMYEKSNQGWHESEKIEEMTEEAAWYLVAIDKTNNKPIAFSHFRFDMDYGDEVLYCYELQLEESCRRKGLGRFMMQVLELMAFSNQMQKVVLTVFQHNPDGMDFFKKCRYDTDETSPEDSFEETFDYLILSKLNKMKPKPKVSL